MAASARAMQASAQALLSLLTMSWDACWRPMPYCTWLFLERSRGEQGATDTFG